MYSAEKEYKENKEFKQYVNKYAVAYKITPEEALTHVLVYLVGKSCYDKRTGSK